MNKCLKCGKGLRVIKNEFSGRKYHKKCWFEKLDEDRFNFYANNDMNKINDEISKLIDPVGYEYRKKLEKEVNEFLESSKQYELETKIMLGI